MLCVGNVSAKVEILPHREHSVFIIKTKQLIAVCSENHMKCINTFSGQNTELFTVTVGTYYN
jgi:hypothetical protein